MQVKYKPQRGGRRRTGTLKSAGIDHAVVFGPKGSETVRKRDIECPWMPCGCVDCAEFGPRECPMR